MKLTLVSDDGVVLGEYLVRDPNKVIMRDFYLTDDGTTGEVYIDNDHYSDFDDLSRDIRILRKQGIK